MKKKLALIDKMSIIAVNQDLTLRKTNDKRLTSGKSSNEREPASEALANKDGKDRRNNKTLCSFGPQTDADV